uniref:Uncharacterized protein n=1 Tax=Setaria italica TaxID=4555 RepID=K3Z8D4_SETIT
MYFAQGRSTATSTLFDDGEGAAGEGRGGAAVAASPAAGHHGHGLLAVEPRLLRDERLHRAPELVRVVHAPTRLRVARRHGRPPPSPVLRLGAPQLGRHGAPRQPRAHLLGPAPPRRARQLAHAHRRLVLERRGRVRRLGRRRGCCYHLRRLHGCRRWSRRRGEGGDFFQQGAGRRRSWRGEGREAGAGGGLRGLRWRWGGGRAGRARLLLVGRGGEVVSRQREEEEHDGVAEHEDEAGVEEERPGEPQHRSGRGRHAGGRPGEEGHECEELPHAKHPVEEAQPQRCSGGHHGCLAPCL